MLLSSIRRLYAGTLSQATPEQLVAIPEGFNNNILWNIGHAVVTQQLLTYGLTGNTLNVSDEFVAAFRKGSSPKEWESTPDVDTLKRLTTELPKKFAEDYDAGIFENFKEYTLSTTGDTLTNIDDAVAFNDFHEGIHLGSVLALRKLV